MKHEEYTDLLTADALGALDAIERRELEAHLASCAECRAEADVWREVAATLAYAAPSVAPPAALRERLFEQIKPQPPISRAEAVTKTEADSKNSALPKPTNVVALDAEREKRRGGVLVSKPLLLVGSLAASIAIAALAITLAMAWAQNRHLQEQLVSAASGLLQSERELAALRAERDLLAAPASRTVALAGTEVAAAAQARLTYDQQTGRAVLVAANLPPVPAGK
ncbi:MAG: zf-HC2 domain-containing protein, partial [Acidobacteriota bacterium]|nr:zf-HC2 domain-containing protein [Acidobacteriota bacterium]